MDLDDRQTRRLSLAGTVAFPTPFPSVGVISFESGRLTTSPGVQTEAKAMVVVQDRSDRDWTRVHSILQKYVAAVFIPGRWNADKKFEIFNATSVDDVEIGEWFVDADVSAERIRARLKLKECEDTASRDSVLRGIAFVHEYRPVISNTEMIATAIDTRDCDWQTPRTTCLRPCP